MTWLDKWCIAMWLLCVLVWLIACCESAIKTTSDRAAQFALVVIAGGGGTLLISVFWVILGVFGRLVVA